jgi:hypothetical protein
VHADGKPKLYNVWNTKTKKQGQTIIDQSLKSVIGVVGGTLPITLRRKAVATGAELLR